MRALATTAMDVADVDDAALLAAVATGDHAAFAALYARHRMALYWSAYRVVGDHETAEDVVQQAFLNLWRRAKAFDPTRGDVTAWLFAAGHNAALDTLRRRAVHGRGAVSFDLVPGLAATDDPQTLVERREARRLVRRGIAALPAPQREALELAYDTELTCAAIAARIAVPIGTVKGRQRLARAALRIALAPFIDE